MTANENQADLLAEVIEIFRDVFDDPDLSLSLESSNFDIEAWDSLAHIQLIAALEERFGLEVSAGEIVSINTVGHIISLIEEKKTNA